MSTMATSPEKTTSSITVRTRVWYDLTLTETGYTIKNCQTQCEAKQASSFGSYTPLMIYEYWGLSATDEGGNTVWLVSSGQTSISMGVVSTTAWSGSIPHSGSGTLTGTRGHSAKTVSLVTNHCGFKDDGASNHYSGTPVTVTIPAKASYAVSFNANGGSGTPSAQTKWYNEYLTITSTKPTRSGYSFIKWNTKSDGTGTDYASGSTYTGNSAITLYAIWGPIVSYNANGGTGAPAQAVKTPGTPIAISTTQPTRTGYTFAKWNTSADGSGTDYSPGASYSTDAPLALYAQWTPNTYQVSFDANTGKHAPSAINRTYGQSVTLPSAIPVKMAADFVGWATNSSGTGTLYQPGGSYTSTVAAAEILYAVWRSTYTDPAFAIDVVRTDDQGVEEDDGDHALITVLWSINPLIEPDTGESTNTATLECYMSYIDSQGHTITTEVTLEDAEVGGTNETQGTKTSGTARALISNIDTDTRYTIEVTIVDSRGTSVTKTEILSMAFFTMDFLAGGHGVGIGKAATREMFDVGMQTQFDKPIKVAETDVPPTFYYTTKPSAVDLPVRPCIVIQTSDWSVWYCDNETSPSYHQLTDNTKILKSGDTMDGWLLIRNSSIDRDGSNPSSEQWEKGIALVDKDREHIGQLRTNRTANGASRTMIRALAEKTDGTEVDNAISIYQYRDGSRGYSVSDAAAFRAAIGAVNKAGDTMTGVLTMNNVSINSKSTSINQDASTPSSDQYFRSLQALDADNQVIGMLESKRSNGNLIGFSHSAVRYVSGSYRYNQIICYINASGGFSYSVSDQGAFRSAINAVNKAGDTMTGLLNINTNGTTLALGATNTGWTHITSSANRYFYFNRSISVDGDFYIYNTDMVMLRTSTNTNSRLKYIVRADDYLHVATWSHGAYGVTWWASDVRMKDNIDDSEVDALALVNAIPHRSFDMKSDGEYHDIGYIAQELEELDPQMVTKVYQTREVGNVSYFTGDYVYQVDERKVIPYLSRAIQQLSERNSELERKNSELESRLEAIERKLGL